jgi:cation:H+ antiporter
MVGGALLAVARNHARAASQGFLAVWLWTPPRSLVYHTHTLHMFFSTAPFLPRYNGPMGLLEQAVLLVLLLLVVGKSAAWAMRSASSLSRTLGWSEFAVSAVLITMISVLPELLVSVVSALNGVPSLALGTLLGSNVADLTLIFGLVALLTRGTIKVESTFIKRDSIFLSFLLLPLILGLTGHYSRLDGALLIAGGAIFLYLILRDRGAGTHHPNHLSRSLAVNGLSLGVSLLLLTGAAYYTVIYAEEIAGGLGVAPALIGLLVVALGTTLPELLFSVRAAQNSHSALALGDIWGTVIIDATLILGIVVLIHPFSFNPRLVILTGFFMLLAGIFSLSFLSSGRTLTKSEGALLLAFYGVFVIVEFILRDWTPLIEK